MAKIRSIERRKSLGSPVGEIDTTAPFQSVKAAVSLFGEVASRQKPAINKSKLSSEDVLDKETQLLLVQRELNKIKKQLEITHKTKAIAEYDLEKAKRTEKELQSKLTNLNRSKRSALEEAEAVKSRAKILELAKCENAIKNSDWKKELNYARKEYKSTVTQLHAAKQELTKIRQDFDKALETKLAAFQRAAEAQRTSNINAEKVGQLSKEIADMQESIKDLSHACEQAKQEKTKIVMGKDSCLQSYKTAKEKAEEKLELFKKEFDPEQTRSLEAKLKETARNVEDVKQQIQKTHAYQMVTMKAVTEELVEATKSLHEILEEESSLRSLVSSLIVELENVKRERDEQEKIQIEADCASPTGAELNMGKEEKKFDASAQHDFKIQKLWLETKRATRETENLKNDAAKLRQDAATAQMQQEEAERKLHAALKEAEESEAAEKKALDQIKILLQRQDTTNAENLEPGTKIKLSVEEFKALNRKVKSENLAEIEEASTTAEVEVINARTTEAEKMLEANLKVIEEMKIAKEIALKNAEMSESATKMVERELQRRYQEKNKGAARTVSHRI